MSSCRHRTGSLLIFVHSAGIYTSMVYVALCISMLGYNTYLSQGARANAWFFSKFQIIAFSNGHSCYILTTPFYILYHCIVCYTVVSEWGIPVMPLKYLKISYSKYSYYSVLLGFAILTTTLWFCNKNLCRFFIYPCFKIIYFTFCKYWYVKYRYRHCTTILSCHPLNKMCNTSTNPLDIIDSDPYSCSDPDLLFFSQNFHVFQAVPESDFFAIPHRCSVFLLGPPRRISKLQEKPISPEMEFLDIFGRLTILF